MNRKLNDNIETFSNTPSPSESLTNFQKFITFVKKLSVILLDEKRAPILKTIKLN